MKELSDSELLDAYTGQRSEEAFRELVARHVDLIYSAALRQLRNPYLAQEATQSAFIALARKAGQLRRQTIIAGWLHHAVHFAALNLQRSEARRKHWEEEAAIMNLPGETDPAFQELALPHVDGALAELNETDRAAVVLRYLQQKSFRDVAQALGMSEEAAKKRVSRALEKMRGLLARRGVAIPAAVLATGLAQMPVTAAPPAWASTLASLAVSAAGAPTLTIMATLLGLSRSAKFKLAVAIGVLVLAGATVLLTNNVGDTVAASAAATNTNKASAMKIKLTSVMVDDQDKAFRFYTEVLDFAPKRDLPAGQERWLTVVSRAEPNGTELLLEPMGFAPARIYQKALFEAGIPMGAFAVENLQAAYERMKGRGAVFSTAPTNVGPTTLAVLEDPCGNRIQLFEVPRAGNSSTPAAPMIKLTSVMVDDQDKALAFYTRVLGFVKKRDMPAGNGRWLTLVSPDEPDGTELLLEPMSFAPARTYQQALFAAGIPFTAFAAGDVQKEYERMKKAGVAFSMAPTRMGPTTAAIFADTCGNFIQLFQE